MVVTLLNHKIIVMTVVFMTITFPIIVFALNNDRSSSVPTFATAKEYEKEIDFLLDQNTASSTTKAELLTDEAMKLYPGNDFFFRKKAYICIMKGDSLTALGPAEMAFHLNPYPQNAANFVGAILLVTKKYNRPEVVSNDPFARHFYIKGLEAAEVMIQSKEKHANGYLNRGMLHAAFSEYQPAIEDITRAIEAFKDSSVEISKENYYKLYALRGTFYASNEQFDLAIKDFNVAIRELQDINALEMRASSYYSLQQFNEAIQDYVQYLKIVPADTTARTKLAISYDLLGMHQKAVEEQQQVVAALPNDAKAHYELAVAYGNARQIENAKASAKDAIRLSTNGSQYNLLARTLIHDIDSPDYYNNDAQ